MPQHSQLAIFAARKNALPLFPLPSSASLCQSKTFELQAKHFRWQSVHTTSACVCVLHSWNVIKLVCRCVL